MLYRTVQAHLKSFLGQTAGDAERSGLPGFVKREFAYVQHTLRLVLAGFLAFIGALSLYRASVAAHVTLPAWVLLAALVLFLALLGLFLLRGWEPKCKLCHISHFIKGAAPGGARPTCC